MDRDALNNSSSSSVGSVGSAIASSARPPGRPPVGISCLSLCCCCVYRGPAGHDNICPKRPQGLPVSSGSRLLAQKRRSRFAMRVRRSRSQSSLQVRQEW